MYLVWDDFVAFKQDACDGNISEFARRINVGNTSERHVLQHQLQFSPSAWSIGLNRRREKKACMLEAG